MTLDELETAYRARLARQSEPVVIVAMQIPEKDIRALRPRLLAQGKSLSERTRELLRSDAA